MGDQVTDTAASAAENIDVNAEASMAGLAAFASAETREILNLLGQTDAGDAEGGCCGGGCCAV